MLRNQTPSEGLPYPTPPSRGLGRPPRCYCAQGRLSTDFREDAPTFAASPDASSACRLCRSSRCLACRGSAHVRGDGVPILSVPDRIRVCREFACSRRVGKNRQMSVHGFVAGSAPFGATLLGFLIGAATAASVVPVVLYKATEFETAVLVAVCGVVVAPFATLLGIALKNRWRG